jgi:hypothetical protein
VAGLVDSAARAVLDHLFTDPAYVPPSTFYLALSTTTPTADGAGFTEPVAGGYLRLATTSADWSPASGSSPSQKTNTTAFVWPSATDDWAGGANLVAFGLFDALTGGALVITGPLLTPKAVLASDTPMCNPGLLLVKLGDPADPFGAPAP